jgi:hypothetical protein
MKTLIFAFLLAVASASFLGAKPSAINYFAQEALKKIDIKFNSTVFFEGFNEQLGLISNEEAEACIEVALPTLALVYLETQAIASLNWTAAFNMSQITAYLLQNFNTYCEAPYTAYADYFGAAVEAAEEDFEAFLKQVVENWSEGDISTITNLTNLIAFILENNDKGAGEALANLVNIGLSSYLPSKTTTTVVY